MIIRRLLKIITDDNGALRRCVWLWTITAVLQGISFAILVPVLRDLLAGDTDGAFTWVIVMLVMLVVYGIARYYAQQASFRAAIGLSRGLFQRLGDKIATLPLGWFAGDRVGSLGRLTSHGVTEVMGVPAHLLRPIITGFVTPATLVIAIAVFDWRLALATAAAAPVAWLSYRWSTSLVRKADHEAHDAAADAGGRLVEFAQSQAVLRAHGRTVDGNETLDNSLVNYRNAGRNLLTTAVPGLVSFILVIQAAFTFVLFVGVAIAVNATLDAPELIAVLVLIVRSVEPLLAAADVGGALSMADNTLNRADTLLDTEVLADGTAADGFDEFSIRFDRVSFGYNPGEPVLHELDLTVPAGSMTAIVGPSGSGKTTIARLIARFWDVDSGTVSIGGTDVRDVSIETLMANVSIVFQDSFLFSGTIAENLRLAKADATQEELDRVAELSRLDEVIDRLPNGWESDVGEGGGRLSGGERQRVSIARALLKDAPIVLLDEATAAIDPQNEVAIQNAIDTMRHERTILVIAHRLQTVVGADEIVVLEDGHIAERGDHDTLLAEDGRYTAFWTERRRAAGWRLAPANT
ncbi:MAG: ABC transporter ATP-binding protein [Actinomycetota bacterium]